MNCAEAIEKLYAYIDNEMEPLTLAEIEKHLNRCRPCLSRCEFERKLKARFKLCCCDDHIPESLHKRIRAILEAF